MRKSEELRSPTSCLNKAQPDEPVFVLKATDPLFASTLGLWAAMGDGIHNPGKRAEALKIAAEGNAWRNARRADSDHSQKIAADVRTPPMPSVGLQGFQGGGAAVGTDSDFLRRLAAVHPLAPDDVRHRLHRVAELLDRADKLGLTLAAAGACGPSPEYLQAKRREADVKASLQNQGNTMVPAAERYTLARHGQNYPTSAAADVAEGKSNCSECSRSQENVRR